MTKKGVGSNHHYPTENCNSPLLSGHLDNTIKKGELRTLDFYYTCRKSTVFFQSSSSSNFCPSSFAVCSRAQCLKITQNVSFEFFHFGIFNELLATQIVNVARFARNVEWDFFCDFQTLCLIHVLLTWSKVWCRFFFVAAFIFKKLMLWNDFLLCIYSVV